MIVENGKYTIYVLTNTITNKIYVGVTTRSLRERFHEEKDIAIKKIFMQIFKSMDGIVLRVKYLLLV